MTSILHVLADPRGGGGLYGLLLARAARERGWVVTTASPAPLAADFETVPLRAAPAVARHADLVHCHGVRAGLLQPLLGRAPKIITGHGLHALYRTRRFERRLAEAVTRFSLGRACRVICVSADELAAVQSLGHAYSRKARLIRNGVAPVPLAGERERHAARRDLGLEDDERVLLFVGGLHYQKHPELAVEAVAEARVRLPKLVLLVAGDGPLRGQLDAPGTPWLRVLGHRDDVDRLLVACDAVINTSRWEGLSLALLEALWRGRPLIVTGVPGNREAAGNAGIICPSSVSSVASEIVRLFQTPGLRAELGRAARQRAEQLFDSRVMVAETLSLYEELIRS